jgi:hypothetical protein
VIYPWYLLYLTPFLFTAATLPLTAWTCTVLSTYVVWHIARQGGRWVVPTGLMWIEYGVPAVLAAFQAVRSRNRVNVTDRVEPGGSVGR